MAEYSIYGSIVIKSEDGEHSVFCGEQPVIPAGHKIVRHSSADFKEMKYPWKQDVYCELQLSGEGCSAGCRHWLYYCGGCDCKKACEWVYLEKEVNIAMMHDDADFTPAMWCLHKTLPVGNHAFIYDSLFRVTDSAVYLLDKDNLQNPKVVKTPANGYMFTLRGDCVVEHVKGEPVKLYIDRCCNAILPHPKNNRSACVKCGKEYVNIWTNLAEFAENKTWVKYPEAYRLICEKRNYRYDGRKELEETAVKLCAEFDSAKRQVAEISAGPRCKCGAVPKYVYACGHCVCEKCEGNCHCGGSSALRIVLKSS